MLTRGQPCAVEGCQKPGEDLRYNECGKCGRAFHLACTKETTVNNEYSCSKCCSLETQDTTGTTSTHFGTPSPDPTPAPTPHSPSLPLPEHPTLYAPPTAAQPIFLPLSQPLQLPAMPPSYPSILPEFSGRLHEDPASFISACEATLRQQRLPEQVWLHVIKGQLKGEAAQWWTDYGEFVTSWPQLTKRLQTRFASPAKIGLAQKEFYGTEQHANEPVEKFLRQKTRLEQRLNTRLTEDELVGLLINQLLPELKSLVRAARPRDVENLIEIATELEADQPTQKKPKANPFPASTKAAAAPAPSPPKCQHCPQWHYHRHCPVLQHKTENYQARRTNAPPLPVPK